MSNMDKEKSRDTVFGINFRGLMAEKRIGFVRALEAVGERAWQLNRGSFKMDEPTPSEVASLCCALGCSKERLTVSREDVDTELRLLKLDWQGLYDAKEEFKEESQRLREREVDLLDCVFNIMCDVVAEFDEDSRWDRKVQKSLKEAGLVFDREFWSLTEEVETWTQEEIDVAKIVGERLAQEIEVGHE